MSEYIKDHMKMRWTVRETDGEPTIFAGDHKCEWWVAHVMLYLPGDMDGRRTAQAICDAHNAALDAKRAEPAAPSYMQIAADAIRAEAARVNGPMTFAEARKRFAAMAGGKYRVMYYQLTEREDGSVEQSCRLYTDDIETDGFRTWHEALASMARILTGEQECASERDVAAAVPGDNVKGETQT